MSSLSLSLQAATPLLQKKVSLSLNDDGTFRVDSWRTRFKKLFSPSFYQAEITRIATSLLTKLESDDGKKCAEVFVSQFHKVSKVNSEVVKLDFALGLLRGSEKERYLLRHNQERYVKWIHNGQDKEVFAKHQEFIDFCFSSPLASQIKVTRDVFQEVNRDVAINVEGTAISWNQFKDRFKCGEDRVYGEKIIQDKKTLAVYTYLDNRKGLERFDPNRWEGGILPQISTLTPEEYGKVLEKAQQFERPVNPSTPLFPTNQNEKRDWVVQIVTSYVASRRDPFTDNLQEFLVRRKHPRLRLISPEGKVFEVGFNWKRAPGFFFLRTGIGHFRGPDYWGYQKRTRDIVTSIVLSKEEAGKLQDYVLARHNDAKLGNKPGFHILSQNCSVFVREALKVSTGIVIPLEMSISKALVSMLPPFIISIQNFFDKAKEKMIHFVATPLPHMICKPVGFFVEKVQELWQKVLKVALAWICNWVSLLLGGSPPQNAIPIRQSQLDRAMPSPWSWRRFFNLSQHVIAAPGECQEWQHDKKILPATFIRGEPVRWIDSIVPPSN